MGTIAVMRNMISDMYALYAIDLGVQLGFFQQLATSNQSLSIDELASKAKCNGDKKLFESWIRAVQAAGVLNVDKEEKISFREGWKEALTDETSTEYIATLPRCYIALLEAYPKFADIFKKQRKMAWQELGRSVVEDISADGVRAANFFIEKVVDKVPGLREKLRNGATVYDVGCAAGHPTIRLASAFPESYFVGIDIWPEAIELAHVHVKQSLVDGKVKFKALCATDIPKNVADVIIFNDVLHEMDESLRQHALTAMRAALKKDGGIFISDPLVPDTHEDYLKDSTKCSSITHLFEVPFGARIVTRRELETLLHHAGLKIRTEIESSDVEISAYVTSMEA